MTLGEQSDLPHGARAIKIGDISVIFGVDKVMISWPGSRHLTMSIGTKSGILDVHLTETQSQGRKNYDTLFAIRHANTEALLEEQASDLLKRFLDLLRPLGRGWMCKHRLTAVEGLLGGPKDLEAVTSPRSRKLVADDEKLASHLRIADDPDQLLLRPMGSVFAVIELRGNGARLEGVGFVTRSPNGRAALKWCKLRWLWREARVRKEELLSQVRKRADVVETEEWL